jgi:hypothetical protein
MGPMDRPRGPSLCATSPRSRGPRRARRAAALALALACGLPTARAEDADPAGSADCGVWAWRDEDETLRVAYDGLRLGLEEANLPRICLRQPSAPTPEGFAASVKEVVASAPPFVAALGPQVGARLAAAPMEGPSGRLPAVYVDVAWTVAGRTVPSPPSPPVPCAVVRAEVSAEAWGEVLRRLLPGRPQPTILLPWTAEDAGAAALRREFGRAAGVETRTLTEGGAGVDAILEWAPGRGETIEGFDAVVARARALRVPLLSADRGRFGRGAAVVLAPDAALLGRVAAEAARGLVAGEGRTSPLRRAVRATEVWVDLEAADAEGLSPPLPFLASASRLRRPVAAPSPLERPR